jgi:hypothetical protein
MPRKNKLVYLVSATTLSIASPRIMKVNRTLRIKPLSIMSLMPRIKTLSLRTLSIKTIIIMTVIQLYGTVRNDVQPNSTQYN